MPQTVLWRLTQFMLKHRRCPLFLRSYVKRTIQVVILSDKRSKQSTHHATTGAAVHHRKRGGKDAAWPMPHSNPAPVVADNISPGIAARRVQFINIAILLKMLQQHRQRVIGKTEVDLPFAGRQSFFRKHAVHNELRGKTVTSQFPRAA